MKVKLALGSLFTLIASTAFGQARPNPYLEEGVLYAGPYPAEVVRVIDADTIAVSIPLWPGTTQTAHIRLRGIDAPETRTTCESEKRLGLEAKAWVEARMPVGTIVKIENIEPDPFSGRYGGDLHRWVSDRWLDVGSELVVREFAQLWVPGQQDVPWCLIAQEMYAVE